jgi:FAD/FMN-containing dehydrogenase
MARFEFTVPTTRPVAQVKAALDAGLAARLPGGRIRRVWEGDVLRLTGMGADGTVTVEPGRIHALVELKPPLSFMKGKVEQGLRETAEQAARGDGDSAPAAPPPPAVAPEGLAEELRPRLRGAIVPGSHASAEYQTNFGHVHEGRPAAVIRPGSREDLVEVFREARARGLTVTTRGSAHSQSEQGVSRGGLLVDLRSMGRVLEVDAKAATATVEAGALWSDVVAATLREGLVPPVLTNNLAVTVGGTLSIAGVGVASFRHGTQCDQVEELEVVTADGEARTCSRARDPELFWGVLAGLGQIGIITRARLRLRRPRPMTRTYDLVYDDARAFLADAARAMDCGRFEHLESWCSPSVQGLKWVDGVRQPFARWLFPFHLSVEFDPGAPPDDDAMLEGFRPWERVHVEDLPLGEFLGRMTPVFDLWKALGTWEHLHPWMEVVLPWERAADYLDAILPDLPPGVSVGGHVLLWPARTAASEVPLFMHPPGERVVGFGILPAVPPRFWDRVRPRLEAASELALGMGGKRYLSGWIAFDARQWREHFGDRWETFAALKRRYDPDGLLNPGFVKL